jgi:hypothetical protein
MKQAFPTVPKDLLDCLKEVFPDKLPRDPDGFSAIERLIGRMDVMDRLQDEYNRQNKLGAYQEIPAPKQRVRL